MNDETGMSTNRAALYTKIHRILKKHYRPATHVERSVLEHLLHGLCLENSKPEAADEAFARLQLYADWNEVRVTSVAELMEVMGMLADPGEAARRMKRVLQSVFETRYSFDLEHLRKANLGKAIKDVESFQGITPFAAAYVSQHALGGHSIPVNGGVLQVLVALNAVTRSEADERRAPGMERAIPKSKGIEFASLLHQLGVDFLGPNSSRLKAILQEILPTVEYPRRERKTAPESASAKDAGGAKGAAESRSDRKSSGRDAAARSMKAAKRIEGEPADRTRSPAAHGTPEKPEKTAKGERTDKSDKSEKSVKTRAGKADRPAKDKSRDKERPSKAGLSAKPTSPAKPITKKKPK